MRTQQEAGDLENINKLGSHYPDYSTVPHLPNLQDMVGSEKGSVVVAGSVVSAGKLTDVDTLLNESQRSQELIAVPPATGEVVLNASRLKVESETA